MSKKIITRIAPSPTGFLHIGNYMTTFANWKYAKKHGGMFYLRMDDTDTSRSTQEYKDQIMHDLQWAGISWDLYFEQSSRKARYDQVIDKLKSVGRLYACYETPEELELKRKLLLASGKPPIYDRAALKLTQQQVSDYLNHGRKPHYRFLINHEEICWEDMVRGKIVYHGSNLSDPIVVREDGSMTYMLCSAIDDVDYEISHIIRGEDHITNTAMHIQMFGAMEASPPEFGHLSLIKAKDEKISKRIGGFDLRTLRDQMEIEPIALNSLFSSMGTPKPIKLYSKMQEMIDEFDVKDFSPGPIIYNPQDLMNLNRKVASTMNFADAAKRIAGPYANNFTQDFWLAVRENLAKFSDVYSWLEICFGEVVAHNQDKQFIEYAIDALPDGQFTNETWSKWTDRIKSGTGRSGKALYLPLRMCITGMEEGPEMKLLVMLLGRDKVIARLIKCI